MSHQSEMGRDSHTQPAQLEEPSPLGAGVVGSAHLDLIACDGCGRRFATRDGCEMVAAIKGPCPSCGGRFQLVAKSPPSTA